MSNDPPGSISEIEIGTKQIRENQLHKQLYSNGAQKDASSIGHFISNIIYHLSHVENINSKEYYPMMCAETVHNTKVIAPHSTTKRVFRLRLSCQIHAKYHVRQLSSRLIFANIQLRI